MSMRVFTALLFSCALAGLLVSCNNSTTTSDEPTLTQQLKERRAVRANRPETDQSRTMAKAAADLEASGIEQAAKNVGDAAPAFDLPASTGGTIALADLRAKGPVVVTFYRGGWCPYCNLELQAYQREYDDIRAAGASLVAIAPETSANAQNTSSENKLDFPLLADAGNAVARKYGLVFQVPPELQEVYMGFGLDLEKNQGNDSWELPVPATYIIDRDGKIVAAHVESDYTQRMDPKDVVAKLREMQERD